MERKLQEEHNCKMQLEGRLMDMQKQNSMLDCDYKQALGKQDELRAHKDQLAQEVCVCVHVCPCVRSCMVYLRLPVVSSVQFIFFPEASTTVKCSTVLHYTRPSSP